MLLTLNPRWIQGRTEVWRLPMKIGKIVDFSQIEVEKSPRSAIKSENRNNSISSEGSKMGIPTLQSRGSFTLGPLVQCGRWRF